MIQDADPGKTIHLLIRLGLVFLLILWCYEIIKPFIIPLMWAGIIAIAVFPVYEKLCELTSERRLLSSLILVLVLLGLLILPMVMLTSSSIDMVRFIADYLESGKIELPRLEPLVADIPLIGSTLQETIVTSDVESILQKLSPLLKTVGKQLLLLSTSLGSMLLQSIVAIIIAGLFLYQSSVARHWTERVAQRIADEQGLALGRLAVATVSNVAQGILGVAIFQSILSGLGMMLAGVPGTGFWTMVILIVATVQLPPMIVLLPVAIYLFYTATLFVAVSFLVMAIIISLIDTPLRAFLMGRDSKSPILILMIGAIGGMIAFGIIGLFLGAVILTVGYELLKSWLNENLEQKLEQELDTKMDQKGDSEKPI